MAEKLLTKNECIHFAKLLLNSNACIKYIHLILYCFAIHQSLLQKVFHLKKESNINVT